MVKRKNKEFEGQLMDESRSSSFFRCNRIHIPNDPISGEQNDIVYLVPAHLI
jgi:hypothetical protein